MRLELLQEKHLSSILDYKRELIEVGSSFDGCGSLKNNDINDWYKKCKSMENIETCPSGYAIDFKYVTVDDNDEVVGMMSYRQSLSVEILREVGGHIGYSVKPSKRRQGIATWQLKELLKIIKQEGINSKVMITCNTDNIPSKKTILACGGIYQDTNTYMDETVERYWINI